MRKRIAVFLFLLCSISAPLRAQNRASGDFRQLNNEGYKHLRNGEYERAAKEFDEALRLNPDYGLARGNRGIAYFILGRFADALNDFQEIQKSLPASDAALKVYLAKARMGNVDRGLLTDLETRVEPTVYHAVIDYYLGRTTIDAELDYLKNSNTRPAWFGSNRKATLCYAYFYFGERAIIEGNRTEATRLLRLSVETGFKDLPEYIWAKGELENLQSRPEMLAAAPAVPSVPTNAAVPQPGSNAGGSPEQEAPSTPAPANAGSSSTRPPYDQGVIQGHTYKNSTLGIELDVPDELSFRAPEVNTYPGTQQLAITVSADSKPHNRFALRKYIVDEEVKLNADPLAAHSLAERNLDGYKQFVSQAVSRTGFKPIDGPSTANLGDTQCSRTNFAQGHRFHAVLLVIHGDYAISFLIVSNDPDTVERLIKSTVLRFTQ